MRLFRQTREFCEMVKISHSIFALPFALAAALLARYSTGSPLTWALAGKIVLACVFARTAGMAFNRLVDAKIDAANPRTATRSIPAGRLSRRFVAAVTVISAAGFVAVAWWIHALAFALSPLALLILLGYSYTKRFTSCSHLVLGAALGLAPLGAWIAVTGELALAPLLLGLAVVFWTAGFDMIYACQDRSFDASQGLHSIPRRFGIRGALRLSRAFHILAVGLLIGLGLIAGLGPWYAGGVAVVAGLLVYEHSLVRADDLSRVNVAFFTLNGLVSVVFLISVALQTGV